MKSKTILKLVSLCSLIIGLKYSAVVNADNLVTYSSSVNVTVPSSIIANFNEDGSADISSLSVNNNSLVPITVDSVRVDSLNSWSLVPSGEKIPSNTKKMNLSIDGNDLSIGDNVISHKIEKQSVGTLAFSLNRGAWTKHFSESALNFSFSYVIGKENFNATFNSNGGNSVSSITAQNGDQITIPSASRVGYTFLGWKSSSGVMYQANDSFIMPIGGESFVAQWKANENTKYVVNHYQMNLDGSSYSLVETENKTGTTDAELTTSSFVKTYEGFTYDNSKVDGSVITSTNVKPDGSLVIDLYYSRNKYYLDLNSYIDGVYKWNLDGKATADLYVNDFKVKSDSSDFMTQFYYGSVYRLEIKLSAGYSYSGLHQSGGYDHSTANIHLNDAVALEGTLTDHMVFVPIINTITYSITYDLNGGTVVGNPSFYNVDSETFTLNNPVKTGYTFLGWSEAFKPSVWSSGFLNYTTGAIQSTGTWPDAIYSELIKVEKGKTYTFTGFEGEVEDNLRIRAYDSNLAYIGSITESGPYIPNSGSSGTSKGASNVYTPSEDGYVRVMLYDSTYKDVVKFTTSDLFSSVTITKGSTGDRSYVANWRANTYIGRFDGNGATSGSMSDVTVTFGTPSYIFKNQFVKTGYTFTGWYAYRMVSDVKSWFCYNGTTYAWLPDDSITNGYSKVIIGESGSTSQATSIDGDVVTYVAQWSVNKLYIQYHMNGGYLDEEHGSTITLDGEIILYKGSPYLQIVPYGESLESSGYSNHLSNWNNSSFINLKKDGYTITSSSAWNSEPDGSGVSYHHAQNYLASDFADLSDGSKVVTLYANWELSKVDVTFDLNGGSVENLLTDVSVTNLGSDSAEISIGSDGLLSTSVSGGNNTSITLAIDVTTPISWGAEYKFNFKLTNPSITITDLYVLNYKDYSGAFMDPTTVIPIDDDTYTFNSFLLLIEGGYTVFIDLECSDSSVTEIGYFGYYDSSTGSIIKSAAIGSTVGSLNINPTRDSFTFNGWNTKADGSGVSYSSTSSIDSSLTLYAQWIPWVHTVVYDANGGSNPPSSQTKTAGSVLTLSSSVPTMNGYTFHSWNTKKAGGGYQYLAGANYTYDQDGGTVTLYAQWSANKYTVKFNANGGSGSMSNQTMTYGVSTALTKNTFTRSGYTFLGWSTSSSATTATYTDGQSVSNLTSTAGGTVTLYAVWKASKVTVSYNLNGGYYKNESNMPSVGYYMGSDYSLQSIPASGMMNIGGVYDGSSEFSVFVDVDYPNMPASDIEFSFNMLASTATLCDVRIYDKGNYASSPPLDILIPSGSYSFSNQYGYLTDGYTVQLSFTANSSSIYGLGVFYFTTLDTSPGTVSVSVGNSISSVLSSPSRDGYTLTGWNTKADGSGDAYGFDTPITSNLTLYAQWESNNYTISIADYGDVIAEPGETFGSLFERCLTGNTVFAKDSMTNIDRYYKLDESGFVAMPSPDAFNVYALYDPSTSQVVSSSTVLDSSKSLIWVIVDGFSNTVIQTLSNESISSQPASELTESTPSEESTSEESTPSEESTSEESNTNVESPSEESIIKEEYTSEEDGEDVVDLDSSLEYVISEENLSIKDSGDDEVLEYPQ